MASLFESYERRINQINAALAKYGIKDLEEAKAICEAKGSIPTKCARRRNRSASRMLNGHT